VPAMSAGEGDVATDFVPFPALAGAHTDQVPDIGGLFVADTDGLLLCDNEIVRDRAAVLQKPQQITERRTELRGRPHGMAGQRIVRLETLVSVGEGYPIPPARPRRVRGRLAAVLRRPVLELIIADILSHAVYPHEKLIRPARVWMAAFQYAAVSVQGVMGLSRTYLLTRPF
jgi:hypothetical protein